MPDYRRLRVEGGTYFLTLTLHDRRSGLLTENIHTLRIAWADVLRRRPFCTIACVVLPDHLHVVVRLPEGDDDYSTRISLLKAGFTRRLSPDVKHMGRKRERGVWQRRFWEHAIRDDDDLKAHVDYVHFNPVKHGYVESPDAWPYSTWHRWNGKSRALLLR